MKEPITEPAFDRTNPAHLEWSSRAMAALERWMEEAEENQAASQRANADARPARDRIALTIDNPNVSDAEILALRAVILEARARSDRLHAEWQERWGGNYALWRAENPRPPLGNPDNIGRAS